MASLVMACGLQSRQTQQLPPAGWVTSWHVGSLSPDQGLNLHPLHCKPAFLTTGPPGKSSTLICKKTFPINFGNVKLKIRGKTPTMWLSSSMLFLMYAGKSPVCWSPVAVREEVAITTCGQAVWSLPQDAFTSEQPRWFTAWPPILHAT